MNNKIDKIKKTLMFIIIATIPVMKLINLFGKVKINFAISDIFVAILVLLALVNFIKKRTLRFYDFKLPDFNSQIPYWWYFAGLITLMIISNTVTYFDSEIQSGSILLIINEGIKFILSAFYFYIGYYSINQKNDFIKVVRIWVYTSLSVAIIGIIITVNTHLGQPIKLDISSKRLIGTLTDPNLAAAYLNISFYIMLLFVNYVNKGFEKYIGYSSLLIIAVSIFLTQSRSGIIAFIISLLVYSILNIKGIIRYVPIILLVCFIGYFGILDIDAIYFDKNISSTLNRRFEQIRTMSGEAEVRLNLAKAAFEMGKDHPIIGVGRGNYRFNSRGYYEQIGINTTEKSYLAKYEGKIPHNTYATFFAELGIFGLILFITIFIKAIKLNLKNSKISSDFKTAFIAILSVYLVQSLAINLENFRGIWIILGLIFAANNFDFSTENSLQTKKFAFNKRIAIVCSILMVISVFVFLDAAEKYTKPIELGKEPLVEYIEDIIPNEEYVFRYYIEGYTDSREKPSSYIKVWSVDSNDNQELLNEITYWAPRGWGNLLFTPKENTKKIKIEIVSTNYEDTSTKIKDAKVVNLSNGEGRLVFVDYKYLPNNIEDKLVSLKLIKRNIKENVLKYKLFANKISDDSILNNLQDSEKKSIFFDGSKPVNMSNKVLFLGVIKEDLGNGRIKLKFKFKCIGKMDVDYVMWLHGNVIDKYILSDDRIKYGFANWDHKLEVKTSAWEVGKVYEHEYVIKANPGQYNIRFGFWNFKWKDGKMYRLMPEIIDLGLIQVKKLN